MANDVKVNVKTTQEGKEVFPGILGQIRTLVAAIPGVGAAFGMGANAADAMANAMRKVAEAVQQYADAQQNVAKLDAALAQNGFLSDANRERYQELAADLQKVTSIASGQWIQVLTRLTQFGSTPESVGMDVQAVKNLAGIIGDVSASAAMYGRALQGNYEGFRRLGIYVSETGDQVERLKSLWEQLELRGGGQLEAQAKGINGLRQAVQNAGNDVLEALGRMIAQLGVVQQVLTATASAFEWWADLIGGNVDQIDGLTNAVRETSGSLEAYKSQLEIVAVLSERIAKAAEAETKAIREKQKAIDEVADAQMALDIAKVEEAQKSGRISERQAIAAKYRIRKDAAAEKFKRDQQADFAELNAKEQAFVDQKRVADGLSARRRELEKRLEEGGYQEKVSNNAAKSASQIQDEIRSRTLASRASPVTRLLGFSGIAESFRRYGSGFSSYSDDQLQELLKRYQSVGPVSLQSQRAELADITKQEASAKAKADAARQDLLGSPIPTRMATREATFGLNQQKEAVVTQGEMAGASQRDFDRQVQNIQNGTASVSGGLQEGLQAVQTTNSMVIQFAAGLVATQRAMDQRVRQLENQVKNAHNR